MPEFDIVIPHYGMSDRITGLAAVCLRSIRRHSEKQDYRLILVDNGTSPERLSPVLTELDSMPHLLIRNTENVGFVRATNQGMRLSTAPYVVLMNNDTEAVPDWLPCLKEPVGDDVGLVGPLTTAKGSWQGNWIIKRRRRWAPLEPRQMLAFFCVLITREVIDKVGYLDEDFGVGFADDDNYSWRAVRAGFRLALSQVLVIPHHHRSSFRTMYTDQQIREMQACNLDLHFKKKRGTAL